MNGRDSSAAPTGCYKCGRPGHWSRDCPNDPTNPDDITDSNKQPIFQNNNYGNNNNNNNKKGSQIEKPKRVPKSRPKLTSELLLSDDGIGFVMKHFPSAFKYHGRGREVSDLGNLIGLYAEWHSQLIPYYSFDQFVNKVEQVGTTRRVKLCLGGLRDRVAHGGDLTKLHDTPIEDNSNDKEEIILVSNMSRCVFSETMNSEEPNIVHEDVFNEKHDIDNLQEDMLQEMYDKATEVPNPSNPEVTGTTSLSSSHNNSKEDVTNEISESVSDTFNISKQKQISDEQKARMEANRLKAMEKAAARARSTQVT